MSDGGCAGRGKDVGRDGTRWTGTGRGEEGRGWGATAALSFLSRQAWWMEEERIAFSGRWEGGGTWREDRRNIAYKGSPHYALRAPSVAVRFAYASPSRSPLLRLPR